MKARLAVDLHVENCPAMWAKLQRRREGAYTGIRVHTSGRAPVPRSHDA
jgi:hypothetical protein